MPRTYTQKNPYFKNSRLSVEQTERLVLMYLKGVKTSQCAEMFGVSHLSIGGHYKKLDEVITDRQLFNEFVRYLDDQDEIALKEQLYIIHGILWNINRIPESPDEDWERECNEADPNYAFFYGDGDFYPKSGQIDSCVKWCNSETPPLVVRKMIDEGKLEEVREKRLSCHSCPMRLKEIYKPPSDNRKFLCKEEDGKELIYEPNIVFQNNSKAIIFLWVNILWFLGHLRQTKDFNYFTKIIHASYFAALKHGEYKVENVVDGAGDIVPTPLLYPEQKEAKKNGISFVSRLDKPLVQLVLEALLRNQ